MCNRLHPCLKPVQLTAHFPLEKPMSRLLAGACPHDLTTLRTRLNDRHPEARLWAVSLLPWERSDCEEAAALAIDALGDSDPRVSRAALRSLADLAPRLVRSLADESLEKLAEHIGRRAPVGDSGAITALRWMAPARVTGALESQLARARRSSGKSIQMALGESVLWSLESGDAAILGTALEVALRDQGTEDADVVDVLPSLLGAVADLDYVPAASLLVASARRGISEAEPSILGWLALVLIAGLLGLAEEEEIEAPDFRELGARKPATAINWLLPALERLGRAGVEIEGLERDATAGRWPAVFRAMLEDCEEITDDPAPGTKLAATLLTELARAQGSGGVPSIMAPWAALVAAAARLRLSPDERRRKRQSRPAPLPPWNAGIETVLDSLGSDHLAAADREELAQRALRLARAGGDPDSALDPAAKKAILDCALTLWTDADLSKAQAGLVLLVALADDRGDRFVRDALGNEEADGTRLVRATRAAGFGFDRFAPWIETLLESDATWERARALRVLAVTPTRGGWAEPLLAGWEKLALADMESLVGVAYRLPDEGIAERMVKEARPRAPRTTGSALVLSALLGAENDQLEELRKIVRSVEKSGRSGSLPDGWLELRCGGCGRLSAAPVDRLIVDAELLQRTNAAAGMLPGKAIRCPRCDAVDELAPLVGSAMTVLSGGDRSRFRPAELSGRDGRPLGSVREFLGEGYDPELPSARKTRARRLISLGRMREMWTEIESLTDAESEVIRALGHLEERDFERSMGCAKTARERLKLQGSDDEEIVKELDQIEEIGQTLTAAQEQARRATDDAGRPASIDGPASSRLPKRNAPCHCGSGRKFKHCCIDR